MRILRVFLALGFLLVPFATPSWSVFEISECGTEIPENETGYLIADLDCSDSEGAGVVLGNGARLVLGGFRIEADPTLGEKRQGVRCRTSSVCRVIGPGEIIGFSASGIAGTRVHARDVLLTGNAIAGVVAYENIRLHNVVIEGNGLLGVHAGGKVVGRGNDVGEHALADVLQSHAPRFRPARGSCSHDGEQG
jgi:hypothetical protein